jgi:hypothetical protein
VRQFSPVVTIGGGVVLDASPISRAHGPEAFLQSLAEGDAQSILRARIERRSYGGITIAELIAETGWPRHVVESHLSARPGPPGSLESENGLYICLPWRN